MMRVNKDIVCGWILGGRMDMRWFERMRRGGDSRISSTESGGNGYTVPGNLEISRKSPSKKIGLSSRRRYKNDSYFPGRKVNSP
jgi:hypothetical protein